MNGREQIRHYMQGVAWFALLTALAHMRIYLRVVQPSWLDVAICIVSAATVGVMLRRLWQTRSKGGT